VTSREPLGVPGEVQWVVRPLAGADAVRLFLDRAEALRRHALDELDAATVAEVCDRLDGLPLALELAAARVKALPIDQIAERLRDRFRLLTGGNRTALPRQQTLRALVDWSYELLFADERRTFRLLSVFAGRFELDQAEELCALAGMDVSLAATLEGLAGASAGAGDPEAAARLLGAAEAARERQGAVLTDGARFDVDRVCDAIRSALGAERHAAAHAAGRALSPHDALALVGADA